MTTTAWWYRGEPGATGTEGRGKKSCPTTPPRGGATSLFTTVLDLVQWHRHLDEGLLGGPEALRTLLTPAVLTSGDTLKYALGIQHGSYRGVPPVSHSGDPGGSSRVGRPLPERRDRNDLADSIDWGHPVARTAEIRDGGVERGVS